MSNEVHEVMDELSQAHYLGDIKSIVVVTVNKNGEAELRLSIAPNTIYPLIVGVRLLELDMLNTLMSKGGKDIKRKDI